MKVLFFMRSTVYVRNFESTLRLLAQRGHQVNVVADTHQVMDPTNLMGRLCREYPNITHAAPPQAASRQWSRLGVELRKSVDYLRYLEPAYRDAPKLRQRAALLTPFFVTGAISRRLVRTGGGRRVLRGLLRSADRAVPQDPAIMDFIRAQRPDVVLVTPLVEPGSPQSEYLRAARALGIPTGLCVYSWDNLTSKGLIHEPLDLVTVWNQAMKDEAVALHRVPAARVIVTGAAAYDHWFTWTPRASRAQFCARVGLDPGRPYLLYLCSSKFIAPNEVPFVKRWIEEVRAASPGLAHAGILIRPHPQNMDRWRTLDVSDFGNVAIWPRRDGNPTDEETRSDYYDSISYSAAVVGINTTALIESAIVGRGVYTVLAPEFRDTQDGTLHFRHLRDVNGGLLHVASDMRDHAAQLDAALRNPEAAAEPCRRFVEAFVRPFGIGEPAAPRLVAALEAAAASGSRRTDTGPWWAPLVRPALARVAVSVEKALAPVEQEEDERRQSKRVDQARRTERRQTLAAQGAAIAAADHPDAVTFEELRRYREAASGGRAADYETDGHALRGLLERDLRRLLVRGDESLWVDEPPVPGSFGFRSAGKRYNQDTLRFFRVISLLQDAALIKDFRAPSSRRTVWEIGGGWGGFAYHFKTLCPNSTYLITGREEQLALSAVYLRALFPDARFRFYESEHADAFWRDWACVDFAFAPEAVVPRMTPPSVDLTVDLLSLEHMSESCAGMHVQRAYDLGSRYFVSIGPSGPGSNGASPVLPAIERLYWRHPVCAPESLAKRLSLPDGPASSERTYFLGWKRRHS